MVLDRGDGPPLGGGFSPAPATGPGPASGVPPSAAVARARSSVRRRCRRSSGGAAPTASLPYGGPPGMPSSGGAFGGGSRGGFGGSAGAASIGTAGTIASGGPRGCRHARPRCPTASPGDAGKRQRTARHAGGRSGVRRRRRCHSAALPMPSSGSSPSIFGRGGPVGAPQTRSASPDPEKKVLVDLGLEYDPDKASGEIKQLKVEIEKANANYEREVADGKRIRAESADAARDRIEELKAAGRDHEEQAAAHDRVSDQLREGCSRRATSSRRLAGKWARWPRTWPLATRAARAAWRHSPHKIRDDMQDLNRQLMELIADKDEGLEEAQRSAHRDRAPARGDQRAGADARGAPRRPDLAGGHPGAPTRRC